MKRMDEIGNVLAAARTIAVVGCSAKPDRASHRVAEYLQRVGYRMIPVNPGFEEILGERCYPDLGAIPDEIEIDIVDVFRRPEYIPAIAKAAVDRGVRALWLQLDVTNPEAERFAAAAGLFVVSDRCIKIEHTARF